MSLLRCDGCGRYVAYKEVEPGGGASECYVPDSHFGPEETLVHCKRCTDTHGMPLPKQSGVNLSVCQRRL